MKLIGIRHDTFDDRKTGRSIEFCHLYVTYEKKGVTGEACEVLKVSSDCIDQALTLTIGAEIRAFYDRYGKVGSVEELPSF